MQFQILALDASVQSNCSRLIAVARINFAPERHGPQLNFVAAALPATENPAQWNGDPQNAEHELSMKSDLFVFHVVAVLLAAAALWSIRHEFTQRATTRLAWAFPPLFAVVAAAILLIVSPGKRVELWAAAIVIGFLIGLGAGTILKINQDFGLKLMRVQRSWDGVGAAILLLLLALARLVSSRSEERRVGKECRS